MSEQEQFNEIWSNYDVNGDGTLKGQELLNFLNELCEVVPEFNGKQQEILAVIDTNGDKTVSKAELWSLFQ